MVMIDQWQAEWEFKGRSRKFIKIFDEDRLFHIKIDNFEIALWAFDKYEACQMAIGRMNIEKYEEAFAREITFLEIGMPDKVWVSEMRKL